MSITLSAYSLMSQVRKSIPRNWNYAVILIEAFTGRNVLVLCEELKRLKHISSLSTGQEIIITFHFFSSE